MKTTKTIIAYLVLAMALWQGPYLYYFLGGFQVFMIYPYMAIGFGLSMYLLYQLRRKETNTPFMKIACIASVALGIASLFSEGLIEKVDWALRRGARDTVVEQVKRGDIEGGQLKGWYLLPISNRHNAIQIEKPTDKTIAVTFYINTGFLDHYSAFLYTNDPEEMKGVEERIASGKRQGFAKLDTNWYRVNY